MPSVSQPKNLGDLLKYEAPNLYSREQGTVATAQNLPLGTVVGRETATTQLKALDPTATDGSETAVGVLAVDIDATQADRASYRAPRHPRPCRAAVAGRHHRPAANHRHRRARSARHPRPHCRLTLHPIYLRKPTMQNPFIHPAFSMAALTAAINILPNRYGRLEDLGLLPLKPVRQRQIIVEELNGVLNLLPTLPPGAPGTVGVRGKRTLRSFVIPHIPHDDVVLPEEVQGLRAFGSETETEAVAGVIARHLETMRNKHAITLEHLRIGALKGVILDADGSVLYDLFNEFAITPQTIAFDLGNAGTNVKARCLATLAAIEDNLKGEFMNGVHCLCSPEFFSALTGHAKVEKAFENWQQGAILINDVRRGFTYAGITFEEYRGQATDSAGLSRRFIAAGEAHAFPIGTIDTFATYVAPADFNETVNTLGLPLYAKQEPRKFERGTDLHTQANPLPMCHRPGVLIKLTA